MQVGDGVPGAVVGGFVVVGGAAVVVTGGLLAVCVGCPVPLAGGVAVSLVCEADAEGEPDGVPDPDGDVLVPAE